MMLYGLRGGWKGCPRSRCRVLQFCIHINIYARTISTIYLICIICSWLRSKPWGADAWGCPGPVGTPLLQCRDQLQTNWKRLNLRPPAEHLGYHMGRVFWIYSKSNLSENSISIWVQESATANTLTLHVTSMNSLYHRYAVDRKMSSMANWYLTLEPHGKILPCHGICIIWSPDAHLWSIWSKTVNLICVRYLFTFPFFLYMCAMWSKQSSIWRTVHICPCSKF